MDVRIFHLSGSPKPNVEELVHKRLSAALGRFETRITQVEVRLRDVNGPRGGADQECQLAIKLRPTGDIFITETAEQTEGAVSAAADRASEAVRRQVGKNKRGVGAG